MKKILSLVLVIALVLGSFSFAFADGHVPADVTNDDQVEAVTVLMALDIVNGYPDGTYKPERVVTRAEMTKLLVETLGYGQLAGGTAQFSDTAGHWAEGYIAIATGIGLVQGYPDGTFKADATVSFDEAITMVVRALGYTDESLKGTWPTNYKIKAIDLGLYDNTTAQSGGAQRGNVAVVLFNALFEEYGLVDADNKWNSEGEDLITKLGAVKQEITISYADVVGDDKLDSSVDLMDYLYETVTAYTNLDGDEVYAITGVVSEKMEYTVVSVGEGTVTVEDPDDSDEVIVFAVADAPMFYNGTQASDTTYGDLVEDDVITIVYDEDSTTASGILAWIASDYLVQTDYDEDDMVIDVVDASDVELATMDDDDDEVVDLDSITVMGDVDSLADIMENDVIYVYASDDDTDYNTPELVKIEVIRDVLSGEITEVNTIDDEVVIGGVRVDDPKELFTTDDLEATVDVALDRDGAVYATITIASTNPNTYAVVVGSEPQTTESAFGAVSVVLGQVKLLVASGDQVVYDVEEDYTTGTSFEVGAFVEFELNSDGEVDMMVEAGDDAGTWSYDNDTKIVGGAYLLSSDVVIFDASAPVVDKADWDVVAASTLGTTITGIAVTDGDYIDFLYISNGGTAAAETGTYAIATTITNVVGGQKVTAFVDGVATVLYTDGDSGSAFVLKQFTEYEMTAGEVSATTNVAIFTDGDITSVIGNMVKVNGMFYTLASDVVVYEVTYKTASTTIDTVEVASVSDITTSMFVDMTNLVVEDDEVTTIIISTVQKARP